MMDQGDTEIRDRIRAAARAEVAAIERGWDLARLPARRGEEPIEAAVDRLLPTYIEAAIADATAFALHGSGSLPVESAASGLGASSRGELRLFVADWILRGDLADPDLREQDAPLAERTRLFEEVCRRGFAAMALPTVSREPGSGRGGALLLIALILLLVLIGAQAHYGS
jgi:hypothetical protein